MGKAIAVGLVALALVLAIIMVAPVIAMADNGPHGNFSATNTSTAGCAACHRAHTAKGAYLLTETGTYALCTSCHGSTGTGANTDVLDGVYLARRSPGPSPLEGVAGKGLLAGGFQATVMNTGLTSPAPGSRATTSAHIANGATGTVWGFGPINSTPDLGLADFAMDCANCHNPHGMSASVANAAGSTATYRILRSVPTGVPYTSGPVNVPDYTTNRVYTVDPNNSFFVQDSYFGQYYNGIGATLAKWCAQCHTRYLAGSGGFLTPSGDAVYQYRHTSNTNMVNCLSCHVAHGSSAVMTTYADMGVVSPGIGTTAPDSSLLRLDERGVCLQCHDPATNPLP